MDRNNNPAPRRRWSIFPQRKKSRIGYAVMVDASTQTETKRDIRALSISEALEGAELDLHVYGDEKYEVKDIRDNVQLTGAEQVTPGSYGNFFQKPYLHQFVGEDGVLYREFVHRKASWGELFYDLIFVAMIGRLAEQLNQNTSFTGIYQMVIVFAMLWNVWIASTLYHNRFDTGDIIHKAYAYFQMLAMVGISVHTMHPGENFSTREIIGISASNIIARGSTILIHIWAGIFVPSVARPWIGSVIAVQCISTALYLAAMIAAVVVPQMQVSRLPPLWVAAELVQFIGGQIPPHFKKFQLPLNVEHMVERMGLFVVIVLGEIVVETGLFSSSSSSTMDHPRWQTYICAAMGLAYGFALQTLYYDVEGSHHHIKHAIQRNRAIRQMWHLIHFPLATLIVAASVGLKKLIDSTLQDHDNNDYNDNDNDNNDDIYNNNNYYDQKHNGVTLYNALLFCVPTALILNCMSIISALNASKPNPWIPKAVRIALAVVAALIIASLAPLLLHLGISDALTLISLVTALMVAVALIELVGIKPRVPDPKEQQEEEEEEITWSADERRRKSKSFITPRSRHGDDDDDATGMYSSSSSNNNNNNNLEDARPLLLLQQQAPGRGAGGGKGEGGHYDHHHHHRHHRSAVATTDDDDGAAAAAAVVVVDYGTTTAATILIISSDQSGSESTAVTTPPVGNGGDGASGASGATPVTATATAAAKEEEQGTSSSSTAAPPANNNNNKKKKKKKTVHFTTLTA